MLTDNHLGSSIVIGNVKESETVNLALVASVVEAVHCVVSFDSISDFFSVIWADLVER